MRAALYTLAPNRHPFYGRTRAAIAGRTRARALGTAQQTQQIVGAAGSGIVGVLPILTHAAWAVPVVGAAVAGVTLALGLILGRKGPWQRTEATKIVDALEPKLKENRDGYMAGPRTRASQAVALANFDSAWAWLISPEGLGNPALGNPGKVGISDRNRGGKWDWFSFYRNPIADDPDVRPDADDETGAALERAGQSITSNPWPWIGAAALAAGVLTL